MKKISYVTSGTCSKLIDLEVDDDNKISNISFLGGCNGNLQGICSLVKGMDIDEVEKKLKGIRCGYKLSRSALQSYRADKITIIILSIYKQTGVRLLLRSHTRLFIGFDGIC